MGLGRSLNPLYRGPAKPLKTKYDSERGSVKRVLKCFYDFTRNLDLKRSSKKIITLGSTFFFFLTTKYNFLCTSYRVKLSSILSQILINSSKSSVCFEHLSTSRNS